MRSHSPLQSPLGSGSRTRNDRRRTRNITHRMMSSQGRRRRRNANAIIQNHPQHMVDNLRLQRIFPRNRCAPSQRICHAFEQYCMRTIRRTMVPHRAIEHVHTYSEQAPLPRHSCQLHTSDARRSPITSGGSMDAPSKLPRPNHQLRSDALALFVALDLRWRRARLKQPALHRAVKTCCEWRNVVRHVAWENARFLP